MCHAMPSWWIDGQLNYGTKLYKWRHYSEKAVDSSFPWSSQMVWPSGLGFMANIGTTSLPDLKTSFGMSWASLALKSILGELNKY